MTLFTKTNCQLCNNIKSRFDLTAMGINIETLTNDNANALAHLAWHGLVEDARKSLPILVLDDSSPVRDFVQIESRLIERSNKFGVDYQLETNTLCKDGSCALQ
jgi:hypothetical protein